MRAINAIENVIVITRRAARRYRVVLLLILLCVSALITKAQQTISLRADKPMSYASFDELLRRPIKLRPELSGAHPRLFFNSDGLTQLRARAKTTDRELWREVLKNMRALKQSPPSPGDAQLDRSGVEQKAGDISQYAVAFALAEISLAYAIERDPQYLAAAKNGCSPRAVMKRGATVSISRMWICPPRISCMVSLSLTTFCSMI